MRTNYYLRKNFCSNCGRYDETHIGKIDDIDVDMWKEKTLRYRNWSDEEGIFDEDGRQKSYDDFWELVKHKQSMINKQESEEQ